MGVGLTLVCATKRRKISKIPHPSPGGRHAPPRAFAADMPCVCVCTYEPMSFFQDLNAHAPLRYAHVGKNTHTHMFSMREKKHFSIFALACFRTLGSIEQEAFPCKKSYWEGERTNSVLRIYALYLVEAISERQ